MNLALVSGLLVAGFYHHRLKDERSPAAEKTTVCTPKTNTYFPDITALARCEKYTRQIFLGNNIKPEQQYWQQQNWHSSIISIL